MSSAQQKKFLLKLSEELKTTSQDYRDVTANKRMHTFVVTRRAIRRGIKDRLVKNFEGITPALMNKVLKTSDKYVKALIRSTGRNIVLLAQKDSAITITKFTPSKIEAAFEATGVDRYNQIKKAYDDQYHLAAAGVSSAIKEVLGGEHKSIEASRLWNLEHNYLKGIAESQVKDAIDNALLEEEAISRASVSKWFSSMGIDLSIIRNGSTGVMEVFIGSQRANSKEGGISGAKMTKLKKALATALDNFEDGDILSNLEGSDSFQQSKIKKVRRNVLAPFKKIAGTKVDAKDLKADDSTTVASLAVKQSIKVSKNKQKRKAARKTKKVTPASSMLQMIAMINKELPKRVKANMGAPALINRTGRFAESVRVTEVIQTRKGFPSIGYTYQTEPYQVFEDGAGSAPWANGNRDPRKLIDRSIREIAAAMAIGRFYTRRV